MSFVAVTKVTGRVLHAFSLFLFVAVAVGLVGYSFLCALGVAPWLSMPLSFGTWSLTEAGPLVQLGLTFLMIALAFLVPSNARILALENSHRNFNIHMDDVARAYHACHTADRAGVFTLSSEFDAVRERLAHLRDHPDLSRLEPEVLEVAAQMSQQAKLLADVYSNEKVDRARKFLAERQAEIEEQQKRIVEALHVCRELKTWTQQIHAEESTVEHQLVHLEDELSQTLAELGYTISKGQNNIVKLAN